MSADTPNPEELAERLTEMRHEAAGPISEEVLCSRMWAAFGCATNPDAFKSTVREGMWARMEEKARESNESDRRFYREARATEVALRDELERLRATIDAGRAIVHSGEADRYRDEACRHTVAQPYADNRFVRLLDDMRSLLGVSR